LSLHKQSNLWGLKPNKYSNTWLYRINTLNGGVKTPSGDTLNTIFPGLKAGAIEKNPY
jgi:hypothetical protein